MPSFAQEGEQELSEDCKKYLSLAGMYGQQSAWRDAANFFMKAHAACGEDKLDQRDWKNGRAIYTKLMDAATDGAVKKGLQDTIFLFYDTELKYYSTPDLSAEYAAKLVKIQSKDAAKIDSLFSGSVHELKEKLSVNEFIFYYIHIIGKFNDAPAEEKDAARDFAIDEYLILSDYISTAIKGFKAMKSEKSAKGVEAYEKAQSYLDNYFGKLAKDCEMITEVLGEKATSLPKDKDDKLAKINTYLNLLEKRGCGKSDLYGQLADSAIAIAPSAEAYFAQAKYFDKREEASKAIQYFEKAVELEGEAGENIDAYNFSLANALLGSKKYRAAFNVAKKVNGEFKGKAMLICAGAIGATANSCGETTFERTSNFWLADDYMKKASALGEEYSSRYASNAPTTEIFFGEGKAVGDRVTLSCWGESTTVR